MMSDDSDDWKPGPAPSWDDLWNANSRLRAALAEAEREIERFREVCKGKTECLHDAYKQRDAARADLAEARELIDEFNVWVDSWSATDDLKAKACAFLERTATASVTPPNSL
jgi:uncharacterized protein